MKIRNIVLPPLCLALICLASGEILAQQKTVQTTLKTVTPAGAEKPANPKAATTAAYAEVFANKVEAEADLKVLTMDYAEDAPQVKAKKLERDLLARQIRWLEALPDASQPKMTIALGKMLVRKAQAEGNLKSLSESYAESHPLVKKAKTRLEVYNGEIEKLLQ